MWLNTSGDGILYVQGGSASMKQRHADLKCFSHLCQFVQKEGISVLNLKWEYLLVLGEFHKKHKATF